MFPTTVRTLLLSLLAALGLSASAGAATGFPTGLYIWQIAGNSILCNAPPLCGDGPDALSGYLDFPVGVATDAAGNVYVADSGPAASTAAARGPATFGESPRAAR